MSHEATLTFKSGAYAFKSGAYAATVVVCAATCETYLRTEVQEFSASFSTLINEPGLDCDLKSALHDLRVNRNRWVHAKDAPKKATLKCYTELYDAELEHEAFVSFRTMVRTLLSNQMI